MRTLTDHKLNGLNDALAIDVIDEPGQGGASHQYMISWGEVRRGPRPTIQQLEELLDKDGQIKISLQPDGGVAIGNTLNISFQNGPIQEAGINGISQESLLAVVIDRLRSFQAGPYSCRENAVALANCEQAMMWLQKRTRDRIARGVEGTSAK